MMRKILVPALVTALLATASIPAHAGGGHRGHSHARVGVYIGAPVVIGGWWGAPRPYYYPAYYPSYYYSPAPVVVVREPLVFYDDRGNPVPPTQVQAQAPAQSSQPPQSASSAPTWFFCADSQIYYPYVQTCASPWQRVIPHPPPQ
jgi:hypothetical protein